MPLKGKVKSVCSEQEGVREDGAECGRQLLSLMLSDGLWLLPPSAGTCGNPSGFPPEAMV